MMKEISLKNSLSSKLTINNNSNIICENSLGGLLKNFDLF